MSYGTGGKFKTDFSSPGTPRKGGFRDISLGFGWKGLAMKKAALAFAIAVASADAMAPRQSGAVGLGGSLAFAPSILPLGRSQHTWCDDPQPRTPLPPPSAHIFDTKEAHILAGGIKGILPPAAFLLTFCILVQMHVSFALPHRVDPSLVHPVFPLCGSQGT